ncbi:hypothetical protein [Actomonas aquatica]|uniref:Uncharacterized protein n=1 Tax=Actomonas aquatica TaxID=2866162 RepID=A0ABZ1C2S6_9BACT|nr:hypothetical protein [Opitutus sp. WL0086]WRQ85548.1 hypothetical protein K1X11_012115 [Opitutus sp. WL0086]
METALRIQVTFALLAHGISCTWEWLRIGAQSLMLAAIIIVASGGAETDRSHPIRWSFAGVYLGLRILRLLRREVGS